MIRIAEIVLASTLAFLVLAGHTKAQSCPTKQIVIEKVEASIKSKEYEAAVVFDMNKLGQDIYAAVVIMDKKFWLILTEFEKGCVKIIGPNGEDVLIAEFNPDMLDFLSKGEIVFEGGKIPSFLEFKT